MLARAVAVDGLLVEYDELCVAFEFDHGRLEPVMDTGVCIGVPRLDTEELERKRPPLEGGAASVLADE